MTLSEQQRQFSLMLGNFLVWIYQQQGLAVVMGEVKRPVEMQKLYVEQGKSKTMQSKHVDSLAVDLSLFVDGVYQTEGDVYRSLGLKWESMGGRWGGRFGVDPKDYAVKIGWDANHFELSQ